MIYITNIISIIIIIIREEVEQKENIAALAVGQAKVDFVMLMMMMRRRRRIYGLQ